MNKEEDGEYPGVSIQQKAKLRAEELHKGKWDRRHQDKEAADLKRSIKQELNNHTTGEHK
eukprot:2802097-Heterocapsa_arctica.AAC.1